MPIHQDERFDDLLSVWRRMVAFCVQETVRIGSCDMLRLQRATYARLREMFPDYNSQIAVNAYKFASEAVKGCVKSCRSNKRTRFPNVSGINSVVLRRQDVGYFAEGGQWYVKIIYKPFERIVAKIHPSDRQREIMARTTPKGARLVKRGDRWTIHAIVEKSVDPPRYERCESVIGVDIGIHNLAVASAVVDGRPRYPLFVSGKRWRRMLAYRRRKSRILQSRGAGRKLERLFIKTSRRLNDILQKASKEVVEYAKRFPSPVIVMERLDVKAGARSKRFNYLLSNWARNKLQQYIAYKAEWSGIPVVRVSPAYTSVTCHRCGERGKRKGTAFYCPRCGKRWDADYNAAAVIARRFSAIRTRASGDGRGPLGRKSPSGSGEALMPCTASDPTSPPEDEAYEATGGRGGYGAEEV